jgi:hypothetical protein
MKESEEVKKPICVVCGNSFEKCIYNRTKIYCSRKCANNSKRCKETSRKWREANKDKIKSYIYANKDMYAESKKKWREANKDKCIEYDIKFKKANRDKLNERARAYKKANREKINERARAYKKANRENIRKYANKKYKTDLRFKLRSILSKRITIALKGTKNNNTTTLIGCTIEEAREHIEKQFKEGMSWENHGYNGWHIDHIIPCASFDLTDPEQQKKCFHYTNLQPLWAKENMSKGSKIPYMGNP